MRDPFTYGYILSFPVKRGGKTEPCGAQVFTQAHCEPAPFNTTE